MFCIKCGAKNPDGSKFCSFCGSVMFETQENDSKPVEEKSSQQMGGNLPPAIVPPQPPINYSPQPFVQNPSYTSDANNVTVLGYENPMKIHCPRCKSDRIISKNQTSTTTKTSGYKGGLGCLGWLLLGPLGLLCGLCGMGSKTTIKNSNCFVCQECGKEFLSVNDKIHELKIGEIQSFVIGVILIIISFLCFNSDVFLGIIILVIGVLFVVGGVFVVKERHEVELKGYEASCYKEEK